MNRLTEEVKERIGIAAAKNSFNVCVDCTEEFARRSNIPIEILWKKPGD